ncbi:hypothetical protein GCM10010435_66120 [Winogradskya consettensis]|uniref:Helix-turn-helix domain-containing protein n=1 Tax=Winogradskya consettensis TaxID=113560 RepID=A0A919T1Z3_9ACTN|nr:helix-turn-helix domain-containing protein [Actinoplanes consettensis]GIM84749.1 hypothetical protein Aco04nite_92960 [Actinoplanes consettensis]
MTNVIELTQAAVEVPADVSPRSTGPAVYTVKQVAALLQLNLGGTYALIRAGDIPAKKLGARWVIPIHRFHAWLDAQADPAPAAKSA